MSKKYEIYIGLKDKDTYKELFSAEDFAKILSSHCSRTKIGFSLVNQLGGYTHNKGYVTETSTRITLFGIEEEEKIKLEELRLQNEKLEKERQEKERKEKERIRKEKIEKERAEQERLAKQKEEQERQEIERLKRERLERERIERENE